jgi:hypothetical protein
MWNEPVVAWIKTLSRHLHGANERNYEISNEESRSPCGNRLTAMFDVISKLKRRCQLVGFGINSVKSLRCVISHVISYYELENLKRTFIGVVDKMNWQFVVRFRVLALASMKITAFLDVTPCSLLLRNYRRYLQKPVTLAICWTWVSN